MGIIDEKIKMINEEIVNIKSINPIEIVQYFMDKDYISIHGPEHHYLDGASFLRAYYNTQDICDIKPYLNELKNRTMSMPGAMCGKWGICGSVASIGASLAIINNTGPLSDNDFYKDNMEFASSVITKMSEIGGPRCCKRNAFISILTAIDFVAQKYDVILDKPDKQLCKYFSKNAQCIKDRCPFYSNDYNFKNI